MTEVEVPAAVSPAMAKKIPEMRPIAAPEMRLPWKTGAAARKFRPKERVTPAARGAVSSHRNFAFDDIRTVSSAMTR
jgi:hypothetical protein